jgi:hypothetical protein
MLRFKSATRWECTILPNFFFNFVIIPKFLNGCDNFFFFFKKKKWFETLDSCAYPIAEVCILEPEFGLINESLRVLLCHNYVIYLLLHRASTLISFPCVWIFETLFIIRIEYFFYRKSFFFFFKIWIWALLSFFIYIYFIISFIIFPFLFFFIPFPCIFETLCLYLSTSIYIYKDFIIKYQSVVHFSSKIIIK